MRNRIVGAIGMVWGGAILLSRLLRDQPQAAPGGAYAAGQSTALIFGALLLLVGAYYFFKKPAV
jgi:hypothetical protein